MSMIATFGPIPGTSVGGLFTPGPLVLSCVINDLDATEDAEIRDYSTVADGDYSQSPGSKDSHKPITFALDLLVSSVPQTFMGAVDVVSTEERVRTILRSKSPIALLIQDDTVGSAPELQFGAAFSNGITMRSLLRSRKSGTPNAVWFTIQISEWRNPGAVVSTIAKNGSDLPTAFKLKKGSTTTLTALSKQFYGNATDWKLILNANRALSPCSADVKIGSTSPYKHLQKVTTIQIPKRKTA